MSPLFGVAMGAPFWMLVEWTPRLFGDATGFACLGMFVFGVAAVIRANMQEFLCEDGKPDPLWASFGIAGSLVVGTVIVVLSITAPSCTKGVILPPA